MFKLLSKVAGFCGYVVQYGCITHCTFEYIGDFVVCVGPSMEPTLATYNVLITDRISPRLNRLQRGDIVIAKSPTNPSQHVCKRIVGMPGDRIMTKASFNLNPLSNNYTIYTTVLPSAGDTHDDDNTLKRRTTATVKLREKVDFISSSMDVEMLPEASPSHPEVKPSIVTVPRGHLWIEGDNVQNSSDSRDYGPVPIGLVKSRAICRLWPLTDFRLLI